MTMTHASLFSGIGGFDLAAEWAGWTNAFNCEIDPFCRKILKYHFSRCRTIRRHTNSRLCRLARPHRRAHRRFPLPAVQPRGQAQGHGGRPLPLAGNAAGRGSYALFTYVFARVCIVAWVELYTSQQIYPHKTKSLYPPPRCGAKRKEKNEDQQTNKRMSLRQLPKIRRMPSQRSIR